MLGSPASGQQGLVAQPETLPIPEGTTAPAAFYDAADRPEPQQRALARIQEQFLEQLSRRTPGMSEEETWAAAKEAADRQYVKIFGFANYQTLSLQAAKEALAEKRAAGTLIQAVTQD